MHTQSLRWIGSAMIVAALAAAPLAAQAPSPPQVTVTGLAYLQGQYLMKNPSGVNRFDVTRAYVNVLGRFAGGIATRVTADIFTNTDSSRAYRIKYAYVAYTPTGSAITLKGGEIHTPWIDWEEALWDYRVQGQMALERGFVTGTGVTSGYVSSSDFGIGADGKWGPDKVNAQLVLVNGENYNKGTGDQGKDGMIRVSARVMDTDDSSRVGGLRITGYAQIGQPTTGGQRQRFLGMASYRSRQITLAGEFAAVRDSLTGGALVKGRVISAFGVYHFTGSKLAIIGRFDATDPNTSLANDRQSRVIGGVSYQHSANLRLVADWDHVSLQGTPTAGQKSASSQALLQAQFTF